MLDMNAPEADIDQYLDEEGTTADALRSYGNSLHHTASAGGDSGGQRSQRNNNPGNLTILPRGRMWPGQTGRDGRFAVFADKASGEAAADQNLQSYGKRGLTTVRQVVSTWAPKSDSNDTDAYIAKVSQALSIDPDTPIDLTKPANRSAFLNRGIFPNEGPGYDGDGNSAAPVTAPAPVSSHYPIPEILPVPKARPQTTIAPPSGPSTLRRYANAMGQGVEDSVKMASSLNPLVNIMDTGADVAGRFGLDLSKLKSSAMAARVAKMIGIHDDDAAYAPQGTVERYGQAAARGLGSALIPGAGMEVAGEGLAARAIPAIARRAASEVASGLGGGIGTQAGHDATEGHPYLQPIAELAGGVIGGGVGAIGAHGATALPDMLRAAKANRFVNRQAAGNPHVAMDHEVSSELGSILASLPTKANGKALSKALTDRTALSRINALDRSYLPDVAGMDVAPSTRAAFKSAIANRQVLSPAAVDQLRAIPNGGDVVANAVLKSQRLRNVVPEVTGAPSGGPSILGLGADAAMTAGGAAIGGTPGALVGRLLSAGVSRAAGKDAIRQSVKLAEQRAALAPQYAKAADQVAAANATVPDTGAMPISPDAPVAPIPQASGPGVTLSPTEMHDGLQAMIDGGSDKAAINQYITDSGYDATKTKGLDVALAYRDKGGKGATVTPYPDATASSDPRDAAYLAAKASKSAKAKAALDASQLTEANRRLGVANDRDDVVAGGGYRGRLYDQTGLKPSAQDAGALMLLQKGVITPDQFNAHLSNPSALMPGGAGLALGDRLGAMADDGTLTRDPDWSPPAAVPSASDGTAPIRNVEAYRATAKGNQNRVTQAIATTNDHPALDTSAKGSINDALAQLGNTSNRDDANAIVEQTLQGLPIDFQDHALSILNPIASQIRP